MNHTDQALSMNEGASPWPRRVVCLLIYIVLIGAVTWGMSRRRRWALQSYEGESARQDWEAWRDEARKQADGDVPVRRRVPKSAEPPALVLMRDYYYQCLVGALTVTTALTASMLFLFSGMLGQGKFVPYED